MSALEQTHCKQNKRCPLWRQRKNVLQNKTKTRRNKCTYNFVNNENSTTINRQTDRHSWLKNRKAHTQNAS